MIKPEEIIPACLGELYRYRLAVHDQQPRLEAATQALVAEGDLVRKDKRELLFAPSMNEEAFRQQLESIHNRNTDLWWRLKTEAQFLVVAVYGILAMSKSIRMASVDQVNSCVQRAISAFEKPAPDADLLRHLHEHMDAYMRGEGKDADRLPDPTDSGVVAALDGARLLGRRQAPRPLGDRSLRRRVGSSRRRLHEVSLATSEQRVRRLAASLRSCDTTS